MDDGGSGEAPSSSPQLRHEVEQFLYREARLLDEWRLEEWLELLAEDVSYRMPAPEIGHSAETASERSSHVSLLEDDKNSLRLRVKRYGTGLAYAEEPRSRTRHFVMNVEILGQEGDELEVHSNVLVFQGRHERSEHFFVAKRQDRLRRSGKGWLLAKRDIVLEHALAPRSLSIFF